MNVYERLGVRRVINAYGNLTPLGGSLMDPEVIRIMEEASGWFVDLSDLLRQAGRRIAELTGVEAAFITSGAAAGLVLATASCLTEKDPSRIARLPDTTNMRNEIIIHKSQRNVWDHAVRQVGVKLVEIGFSTGTRLHNLQGAINERTAAIVYFVEHSPEQSMPLQEVIEVARAHEVPVIVDAAAELPPKENIHRFNDMGADLVIFSGGKMLRGPQCTGLILGKSELIKACELNANPNYGIGRPMKVGKEEIAGIVKAVELFVDHDFDADMRRWERQVAYCLEAFRGLGVEARRVFPGEDPVHPLWVPRIYMRWDQKAIALTPEQAVQMLLMGEPSIAVGAMDGKLVINPVVLGDGEEQIVARRVEETLSAWSHN